jgi:AcrR family transcriptional regulator
VATHAKQASTDSNARQENERRAAKEARAERGSREAILDRAVAVASAEGLEGLTIGRLAGDLQMSKSGVFGHFGSKQELQLATIDEAARRFIRQVVEPALEMEEGAPRLRALCDCYLSYLERRVFPGGCFWAAAAAEFDDKPGAVRERVREAVADWVGELERQAAIAGVDDPGLLAFELQALAQGANSAFQLFGDPNTFRRARAAIDRLLP